MSRTVLLTVGIILLALLVGAAVFHVSARKPYTLTLLATSLEAGEGQIHFEPEAGGRTIIKRFPVFNTAGNQAILVIELPAVALKSLRMLPLASLGNYAIDSITLSSDERRYRWDGEGGCTLQLREPQIQPEEVCRADAPLLGAQDDGSITLTGIPEQGMLRSRWLRWCLAAVAALFAAAAGFWVRNPITGGRAGWLQLVLERVLWVAVVVVSGYQLLLICRYGTDVPYFDEWVYFKPAALPSGFSWSWLFSFHNEHRIFFTYLLTWLNFKLFHLDFVKQMLFNYALYLGVLLLLVRLLRKSVAPQQFPWLPAFIVFLLSPLNWENHLWAFQSQIHLMLLFSLLALNFAFAERISLRSTLLFTGFSLLAMGSFASGLVIALVCLIMQSMYLGSGIADKRIQPAAGVRALALGWLLIGTGIGLWFYGYPTPEVQRAITLPTTGAFWVYFLNILSYGFGFEVESLFPGIMCLVVCLVPVGLLLAARERRREASTWLIVSAITALVVTLAAISMGRASFSIAKHSRYAEFGMVLIPLAAVAWWRALAPGKMRSALLLLYWLGCFTSFANDWSAGKYRTMHQVNIFTLECIERYYRGAGDGVCSQATPAALDAAKLLNVNFTRKEVGHHVPVQ